MREIFTRLEEEGVVYIEVDMDAYSDVKKFGWLLSVFVKFDATKSEDASYEDFLETKESLILALEYDESAKYVGMRVVDGWSELYFYSNNSKELESTVAKMLGTTSYKYETSVVKDTRWDFHYKNIFPTELELCHIKSEKIIYMLQEEGDSLQVPRDVEHYVSFELPTQKERFLESLSKTSFTLKDEIDSEDFEHGLALLKHHAVDSQSVREVVEELFDAVKKFHGFYEGWSTTLVDGEAE